VWLFFLFGPHSPTYKGKVYKNNIVTLGSKMSKHRVIENVCQKPYCSAQRKIHIAKCIGQYPEMNRMTQRKAETSLSKKLKCEKEEKLRRKPRNKIGTNKPDCKLTISQNIHLLLFAFGYK
jgi:hypothetical protein